MPKIIQNNYSLGKNYFVEERGASETSAASDEDKIMRVPRVTYPRVDFNFKDFSWLLLWYASVLFMIAWFICERVEVL